MGTDFLVEYSNNAMNVIVFEGLVKVCNPSGVCVVAKTEQMTSVRSGDNSAPLPPQQAALNLPVAASNDTSAGAPSGATDAAGPHFGVWGTVGVVAGAVGAGWGVGLTRGGTKPPQNACITNACGKPAACSLTVQRKEPACRQIHC